MANPWALIVVRQLHYTPFLSLLKTQLVWRQYKLYSLWQFLAEFLRNISLRGRCQSNLHVAGNKWNGNQIIISSCAPIATHNMGIHRVSWHVSCGKNWGKGRAKVEICESWPDKRHIFFCFSYFLLIYCWVTAVVAKATLSLLLPLQHTCHICQGKNNSCDGLRTTEYLRCDPKTRAGNAVVEQALPIISHNLIKRQIKPSKFVS